MQENRTNDLVLLFSLGYLTMKFKFLADVTPAENLLMQYHEEWGQNVDPVFEELLY